MVWIGMGRGGISLVGVIAVGVFVEHAHTVDHLELQRHVVLHPHLVHVVVHVVGRRSVDLLVQHLPHHAERIETVVAARIVQRRIQVIAPLLIEAGLWLIEAGLWLIEAGLWLIETGLRLIEVGLWLIEVGLWLIEVAPAVVCIQVSPLVWHLVAHIIWIHWRLRLYSIGIHLRVNVVAPLPILHRLASPACALAI